MKYPMKIIVVCLLIIPFYAHASTYSLPNPNDNLIGQIQYTRTQTGDNIVNLAKQYDVGNNAIQSANPHLDGTKKFSSGDLLQVPTLHLLPNLSRTGIIINLPEMRMYYFPANGNEVLTYPIGIGKIGKTIPITRTSITRKTINPTWIPPKSIRDFNLEKGIVLPEILPPGPDNPLGPYAIYMRLPTYLIHSTIFPESVGTRASFGCIRMYEDDIKEFFPSIEKNIPVAIINSPIKAGWHDQQLYLEAHPSLEEHHDSYNTTLPGIVSLITSVTKNHAVLIDWQLVSFIAKERDGVPHNIGISLAN